MVAEDMSFSSLQVTQDGHVAILSLNRPAKFNAMNDDTFRVRRQNSAIARKAASFLVTAAELSYCSVTDEPPGSTARLSSCVIKLCVCQELPAAIDHIQSLDDIRAVSWRSVRCVRPKRSPTELTATDHC